MQSQMGKIEISRTMGKQEISQPQAELMIEQPSAEMNIKTTPSKLTIDQTKAWEEMNLMSILRRNKKFAEEGLTAVAEGTVRRAEQGRELAAIENKGEPLLTQAVANSGKGRSELGIAFIPSPFAVDLTYEPSEVHIHVENNRPIIEAIQHKPEHIYEPGQVHIDMKQYPSLEFDIENPK